MDIEFALSFLGVDPGYDESRVVAARRRALLRHHPDHGGTREALEQVHLATDLLFRALKVDTPPIDDRIRYVRDCPSFTIDVLPVEAFELLVLASANMDADIIDEDPPYMLEVLLRTPVDAWCRCDVVPEAGGSIVTLSTEAMLDKGIEDIRDLWVESINELRPL